MAKRHKTNNLDSLIENLVTEFLKIPNFELTQTNSDANRIFNLVLRKFSEIQDFKTLFLNYYIPSSNKAIVETKREINSSHYKNLINISGEQLKENLYDIIRLGYVGLFHKIESFVNDVLKEANNLFREIDVNEDNISIEEYFKTHYNFKFNNWKRDSNIEKINWISNCVKHYDGFPRKEPKSKYFKDWPENEKLKITVEEFKEDIDYVINSFLKLTLAQIMSFGLYKMTMTSINAEEMTEEIRKTLNDFESKIRFLMN